MELLLILLAAAAVIMIVTAPFRRREGAVATAGGPTEPGPAPEVADLEAAREAKYREIRDAELDHQMGKLSDADFKLVDGTLRAEAISILRDLDSAKARARATIRS